MTSSWFLAFVSLLSLTTVTVGYRYLSRQIANAVSIGLIIWLFYVGILGYLGILADASRRPPGLALILVPVLLFELFFVIRSDSAKRIALSIPLGLLLFSQVFRIGVELFIHEIYLEGLIPRMLTYQGANVDIVIGLTAPLAAWGSTRGRTGWKLALGWNCLGLLALGNIVVRFILTAPGPLQFIHQEVANHAAGTFPYMYIPGFLAPLALTLHIVSIRALRVYLRGAPQER